MPLRLEQWAAIPEVGMMTCKQWLGTGLAMVALAASAACNDNSGDQQGPPATATPTDATSPTAPGATATATAPSLARCTAKDLVFSIEPSGGAAGTHFISLQARNTAPAPCDLYGFPGISLVDGAGNALGQPAERNPAMPAEHIELVPGAVAHADIGFPNYQNFPPGSCAGPSASLVVYAPESTVPLTLPLQDYSCPGFSVQVFQQGPARGA